MLEVLPGSHQGGVVDQGVEELPVPAGPLCAGRFELFLLLMDQLDPWGHSDIMIAPVVCHKSYCHKNNIVFFSLTKMGKDFNASEDELQKE